jgi:hypothetical protein
VAQHAIKGVRMITDEMDFFNGNPLDHVIVDKEPNEAYCRGIEGKEYLLYFPAGGQIDLKITLPGNQGIIRWMSVDQGEWLSEAEIESNIEIRLTAPSGGNWLALIQ